MRDKTITIGEAAYCPSINLEYTILLIDASPFSNRNTVTRIEIETERFDYKPMDMVVLFPR